MDRADNQFHAFCVAGTHSGVGKTTITLALLSALRQRGLGLQPFKCGPDYIDPGHHARAAGTASRNLDTWMMGEDAVHYSFAKASQQADVSLLEGVMGLFDGASSTSQIGSTAHVSRLLDIPVVLVINAKAMARSAAALVHGFATFDPELKIAGIIANNVSSDRHAEIVRESLEAANLPPLVGAIPNNPDWATDERHLGLVTAAEKKHSDEWYISLGVEIEKHVDIDLLLSLSRQDRPQKPEPVIAPVDQNSVRLGVAMDEAFQFYYEDNLDLLRNAGAELVTFSPIHDETLPADLHGLYIGGGYPELYAEVLSENTSMRTAIKEFADAGGHIFAECGGLMYLCKSLTDQNDKLWEMCNVLPASSQMNNKLRRLGYMEAATLADGIFGPSGTTIRGHEFHWSETTDSDETIEPCFAAKSARSSEQTNSGFKYKNVIASYIHLHFLSNPSTAQSWITKLDTGS